MLFTSLSTSLAGFRDRLVGLYWSWKRVKFLVFFCDYDISFMHMYSICISVNFFVHTGHCHWNSWSVKGLDWDGCMLPEGCILRGEHTYYFLQLYMIKASVSRSIWLCSVAMLILNFLICKSFPPLNLPDDRETSICVGQWNRKFL